MRVVQISRGAERRSALVDGNRLVLLDAKLAATLYQLAQHSIETGKRLADAVEACCTNQHLEYEPIYSGKSEWRLLPPFDHPGDPARCMVSGTGLTHKASAENRAAMHKREQAEITDSIRMYQLGLERGSPATGEIGVQPEWFFKGNGSILQGHGQPLDIPSYAWDGGEEPEIAGVYVISAEGRPLRVGLTIANEFSDHRMEKKNYLYLAPSKLRNCSIGPELTIGVIDFHDVAGTVSILRGGAVVWQKEIWTGEKNMSYSIANLEHHHFKYLPHRRPGDVHVHFFGADAFSFGDGIALQENDTMQIDFPQFGRPLRNTLTMSPKPEALVTAAAL